MSPRYAVTIKRWADWIIEADTPEEAEKEAVSQAEMGFSPDSDYYMHECDGITEEED